MRYVVSTRPLGQMLMSLLIYSNLEADLVARFCATLDVMTYGVILFFAAGHYNFERIGRLYSPKQTLSLLPPAIALVHLRKETCPLIRYPILAYSKPTKSQSTSPTGSTRSSILHTYTGPCMPCE